jgi:hypothetical protein
MGRLCSNETNAGEPGGTRTKDNRRVISTIRALRTIRPIHGFTVQRPVQAALAHLDIATVENPICAGVSPDSSNAFSISFWLTGGPNLMVWRSIISVW